jgi:hypothetical protein
MHFCGESLPAGEDGKQNIMPKAVPDSQILFLNLQRILNTQ